LEDVAQIASGGTYTCALTQRKEVFCWGLNMNSVISASGVFMPPTEIPNLGGVVEIAAGHGTTVCARNEADQVLCWGDNENMEAAIADAEKTSVLPGDAVAIDGAAQIAVGGNHACAFDSSGQLTCWGQTSLGATGVSTPGSPMLPTAVDLSVLDDP
jgi:alpha-tubulin suppressor-like RCC1 family protein